MASATGRRGMWYGADGLDTHILAEHQGVLGRLTLFSSLSCILYEGKIS